MNVKGGKRALSPEQERRVSQLRDIGLTLSQISKRMGVSINTVYVTLKRAKA